MLYTHIDAMYFTWLNPLRKHIRSDTYTLSVGYIKLCAVLLAYKLDSLVCGLKLGGTVWNSGTERACCVHIVCMFA